MPYLQHQLNAQGMRRFVLLLLMLFFALDNVVAQPPVVNGWTQFTPSPDSRLIYVSAQSGNDVTAAFYTSASPEIGANPFNPAGLVNAYSSINAAKAQLRAGFPDWILFKKGDVWVNQSFGSLLLYGRNANEPLLIGSYGTATQRPQILTGSNGLIDFFGVSAAFVVISGLYAKPHTRTGSDEPSGVNLTNAPFNWFLIEDCHFDAFHTQLIAQDPITTGTYTRLNLRVRRSIFTDAYKVGGGGHGMFINRVDTLLFEENVIDHNGWNEEVTNAIATGFSHNTYFQVGCRNLTFRRNIVSRASAVGGGHRCGGFIFDNLYLSNPRNILIGTFDGGALNWPTDFVSAEVAYNVILDARVESYDPGNGISVERVTNANVHHNIVAHFTPVSQYNNGISINRVQDVTLHNNIVYHWGNNTPTGPAYSAGINVGSILLGNNLVHANDAQMGNLKGYCMVQNGTFTNITYSNNRYTNVTNANNWFEPSGNFTNWVAQSGETGASVIAVPYSDPQRNIATYMASIGEAGELIAFLNACRQMSKDNWNTDFIASTVNNYIRTGFDMDICDYFFPNELVITGEPVACQNDTYQYTVPNLSGSTFNWTVTGGTILSGQGTHQITVQWNFGAVGNVSVEQSME